MQNQLSSKYVELIADAYKKTNRSTIKIKVSGNSMYPTIVDGQIIDVIPIRENINDIKKNDIIVFQKFKDHFTVHRVFFCLFFSKNFRFFLTKGDNNKLLDLYLVKSKNIIAIVPIEKNK